MNLKAIKTAIATGIAGVPGLENVYSLVPESPTVPCAIIDCGDPWLMLHGSRPGATQEVHLELMLVTGTNDLNAAQEQLDAWCSSGSTEDASVVDVLQNLDGGEDFDDLWIEQVGKPGEVSTAAARYIGVKVTFTVLTNF